MYIEIMSDKIQFETLPTGKPHISFSEVKLWKECSYRHNLTHVKKLVAFEPSPILEFGTAVHSACEHFLLTREVKLELVTDHLAKAWTENAGKKGFDDVTLTSMTGEATRIMAEISHFMDESFPEWSIVDAEHQLYEAIEGHPHAFKGFIDGVVKSKGKRGEELHWIIDWKTSTRGWFREQKQDVTKQYQLALYKNYWCQKNPNVDPKNVRCAFVILKRNAKPGQHCELFTVSLGEVPINRSLKVVSNMLTSVKKGVAIKNRDSCQWCEFKGTEHCT